MSQQSKWLTGITVVALTSISGAAMAEQTIEEVIVTAQKREQSLQDVPIAVSAFSEDMLKKANVEDLRGLSDLTPGFSGRTEDSFNDALSIRGISTNDFGIGGDPSVGIFMDGFYEGRTGGAITSFFDMAGAEVVKGPQGTLFGRNAIAGAISMRTNKPNEEFGGNVSVGLEEYNHFDVTGTINIPLSDKWAFRASGHHFQDDGYLENLSGGPDLGAHDRTAGRMALRYTGDTWDTTATLFYEDRKGTGSVYWDTSNPDLPKDKVTSDLGDGSTDDSQILRFTLEAQAELSGGYSLTSITGYKTFDYHYLEDYDAVGTRVNNYLQDNEDDYFSQEFRLNSPDDGDVYWFVGASFYKETVDGTFASIYDENALCTRISQTDAADFDGPVDPALGCADPNFATYWEADPADLVGGLDNKYEYSYANGDYKGYALYADLTYQASENLDITLGGRYTYDEKSFENNLPDSGGVLGNNFGFEFSTDGFITDKKDWDDFTPRLAATYTVNDNVTLYGNVSKGYKSGGFATFGFDLVDEDEDGVADPGTTLRAFEPETVVSTEVGVKYRSSDRTLQTNVAFYHYDYDNLQLVYFSNGSSLVANVANAVGQGMEVDTRWYPAENFDLYWGVSVSDSEIKSVSQEFLDEGGCEDCVGNELWFDPGFTSALIANYHIPLSDSREMTLTLEHQYEGKKYSGPDNFESVAVPSYNVVNLRLGYDSGAAWTAMAYVENVTDELYYERGWENAGRDNTGGYGLVNTLVWPSRGRVFGVKFSYDF
jgi:iron complex outermembrane receptor protein